MLGVTKTLPVYTPTRQLRSSSDISILCPPSVCIMHSLGQRSLSSAAPSVWNSLPCEVRPSDTLTSFRPSFKSHLFQLSCWLCVCVCACVRVCVRACVRVCVCVILQHSEMQPCVERGRFRNHPLLLLWLLWRRQKSNKRMNECYHSINEWTLKRTFD